MAKSVKTSSLPGIRYREHPTRKHGLKPDRYYFIRYKVNGVLKEEGIGWSSEKVTAESAYAIRTEIRENIKSGKGPTSYAAKKLEAENSRIAAEQEKLAEEQRNITFGEIFTDSYLPAARTYKKSGSIGAETALYAKWISPVIADVSLSGVTVLHCDRITRDMTEAGKSPATIKYALALISQVWNFGRDRGIVVGDSPTRKIKKPRLDNSRVRFFSEQEATDLLAALSKRSLEVRDMAMLGLYCGARAGEIFSLRWGDVDFDAGTIYLRKTKATKARHLYLVPEIKEMLIARFENQRRDDLVFPATTGGEIQRISKTFNRTVDDLGFNDGVIDGRQKVIFHTTRHTFASWLVQRSVPLYTVAKLMGHSDIRMTQRYAHLAPDNEKGAAMLLQGVIASPLAVPARLSA